MKSIIETNKQLDIFEQIDLNSLPLDEKKEFFPLQCFTLLSKHVASGRPSENTLETYTVHIKQFLQWYSLYKSQGRTTAHVLDLEDFQLMDFREYLINQNYAANSLSGKIQAVKLFYEMAHTLKIISSNPMEKVEPPKNPDAGVKYVKYLRKENFTKLLNIIPSRSEIGEIVEENYRDKLIIAIMGIQGLRTIEINRMNEEDLIKESKCVYVRGKGRNRLNYFRDDVWKMLIAYLSLKDRNLKRDSAGMPVFTSIGNRNIGGRMSRKNIRRHVNAWFKKASIRSEDPEATMQASCHVLRHTCGSLLYQETKDLRSVQDTLGHVDPRTTAIYAQVDLDNDRPTRLIPVYIPDDDLIV